MSWNPSLDPVVPEGAAIDAIETVIVPRARDLGGFEVRRALPSAKRQMVGPFIFFDEMGPAEFLTGKGLDVRPHPHIGLATVTYLFRGRIHHRDSLGTDQWIEAGAVNLMTAGQGITHSERMDQGALPQSMWGLQTWLALPLDKEDGGAAFGHTRAEELPLLDGEGKTVRLILGRAWGAESPVVTPSETFYADVTLAPGAQVPLPAEQEDRGAYVLGGSVEVAGERFDAGRMLVFRPGDALALRAGPEGARLVMLGGATLEGPRHIWWNFVASSKERIEAAKEAWRQGDWREGRFALPPGDDAEYIPLPDK
ncbi:pirin family protein [Rubellimicrobium roseum]|uniref:Pirin family protein n=1 Tax=Rubellimicrobium roseum TaxID=687525 RepID=A0A5C4NL01_9RHOB|nr:pirin family protein [Rubellimicrobium roseum]TNC73806.1 pirin family protein [Rubellimicrobium roseum]